MITKLLRWLFGVRPAPIMRDNRYEREDDAWGELERRGYCVQTKEGKNGISYGFMDNGVLASVDWFTCESFEEMQRIRRRWAREELERVLRIEKMESEE